MRLSYRTYQGRSWDSPRHPCGFFFFFDFDMTSLPSVVSGARYISGGKVCLACFALPLPKVDVCCLPSPGIMVIPCRPGDYFSVRGFLQASLADTKKLGSGGLR